MTSLCLIDGHNVLYRTFYALPRLTAPDGTPTNAVLGTARVVLKVLREERPDAVAAVFDAPGPSPRHALYPAYKANRLKIPEELAAQLPLVKEAMEALGVPVLEIPGVEADDVIGTLSRLAEERGMRVLIVSSDKDLWQLVSPAVRVRDGLKEKTVGEAEVREAFGVVPAQVVDLLALAGDPSDNVPGVPGIGEKTASELLREHGTLENLLARADRIGGAKGERIARHAGSARLSRALAEIDRHVPLPAGPEALASRGIAAEKASALFGRLGFRKLLDEILPADGPPLTESPPPPSRPVPFRRLPDAASLLAALGDGSPCRVAAAPAGDGWAFAAADRPDRAFVLPAEAVADAVRGLGSRGGTVYVPDGKSFLRGFPLLLDAPALPLFDLPLGGHLLAPDEGTPSVEKLLARHVPGARFAPAEEGADGEAAARAAALSALGRAEEEALSAEGLLPVFRDVDMPLVPVVVRMEDRGIAIDPEPFRALSSELSAATAEIERKVAALAGGEFNVNSPKQLAFLLFEKLGLPPVKRTKTGYSTDVEVLEQLRGAHPIPALVLEYRSLAKIRSTYVDVIPALADPRDGRVRTTFHLTQTATGRLSSSDPNLQNIPVRTDVGRRIRSGFVAPPGWLLVGADYAQVELRLLAHLSGDDRLRTAFLAGEDVHAATAAELFGVPPGEVTPEMRRRAKVINFGVLYGMSPFGLSRELGIPAREAREYIERFFDRHAGVRSYVAGVLEQARREGAVRTLFGRRRPLRDIASRNKVLREAAERMAVNAPIQGSAADVIKVAMIRADRAFREAGMRAGLVLQIHDELLVEAPEGEAEAAAAILRESMEGAVSLSVPLTVSLSRGRSWGEVH